MESKSGNGKVVCVTGASGFLASWLVKLLLLRGYTVKGTVRDPNDSRKVEHLLKLEGSKERLHLIKANLLEEGSFDSAVEGCEGVFHTASPVALDVKDPQTELIEPAVKGTLNVLKSCANSPSLKRVVLTSSMATAFFNGKPLTPEVVVDETWFSKLEFCNEHKNWSGYVHSKVSAEEAAWKFVKENNIDMVSINPAMVIGSLLQPTLNTTSAAILMLFNGFRWNLMDTAAKPPRHVLVSRVVTVFSGRLKGLIAFHCPILHSVSVLVSYSFLRMDSGNNVIGCAPTQSQGPQPEQQINGNVSTPQVVNGGEENCVVTKKRRKTSEVWKDFEEVQLSDGVKKAVCVHCKEKLATGGKGASTSHLKRHLDSCLQRRLFISRQNKQTTIHFQPSSESGINPFIIPGTKYSNEKMREILATSIMVHECPFSMIEDEVLMWAFEYANPDFRRVTRKTARSDCLKLYEAEKNTLKKILKNVSKVSITTDMWKSSHQVAEYMVVTGHFVDATWNLHKRVLSFVKVPAPRRGVDIANAIFKCLRSWDIENKIFSVSVDNASYNDTCLRTLKDNLSLINTLVLSGKLFHVRCCAHILNLLVQDGLNTIKEIIHKVRESVKFINASDARLKSFCEVVELKGLKERKLIIDCPTRWNSTFLMLMTAIKFKHAFSAYNEKEPHYTYAPDPEHWEKIRKVCRLLEVFNDATHVISGSEYPTSNLYLAEVHRVKQAIDEAMESSDLFLNEMAMPMKEKFDKYWGECNLLMAIASVLDPRIKFNGIEISFPLIYKSESEAKRNVEKVKEALEELYLEYIELCREDSSFSLGETNTDNISLPDTSAQQKDKGMQRMLHMIRQRHSVPSTKSELETYLDGDPYIPSSDSSSFCALEWWKNNSAKFKVLSRMASDILVVPISTVASESTFSAGGRVIDEYRARLNEQSIEVLICGGDWLRNKYGLKKKQKEPSEQEEILLKP